MGSATPQQCEPPSIGNAYLAKVLKGSKKEVDSSIEIQCYATKKAYQQWKDNAEAFKSNLTRALQEDAQVLSGLLLFPIRESFQEASGVCGQRQGKVSLQFQYGLLSLEESKRLHIQENTPFTSFELWNLLYCMTKLALLSRKAGITIDIRAESLFVDLRTKIVKLRNPYSFLGDMPPFSSEKYVDSEKLELLLRKLKADQFVQKQNEDFNIGMMLVQVMLLESKCLIYDDGLSSHRSISGHLHQILIEKVLSIGYYPLKLRVIIAGLIQPRGYDRFTCEEVHGLLAEFGHKISEFQQFHLRKTSFQNRFHHKLITVQTIICKLKRESNSVLFTDGIPIISSAMPRPNSNNIKSTPSRKQGSQDPVGHSESINFSLTNAAKTHHLPEMSQLVFSKSQNKDSALQRDHSFNLTHSANNSAEVKASDQSLPVQTNQQEVITNPFEEFQESKAQTKIENAQITFISPQRSKNSRHPADEAAAGQGISSAKTGQLEKIESQRKIKIENNKDNDQQQISRISKKDRELSQGQFSRSSSVVQYVSQLYQAERAPQTDRTYPKEDPSPPSPPKENEEQPGIFQTFEPRRFAIRKTESYEIQGSSRESVVEHRGVALQNSIIDKLGALASSKKIEEGFKPDKLSESAQKKMEYWNTFSKFSPQVIAQLHLPALYPDTQRLKRSMRETISFNNMMVRRTRTLFPGDAPEPQPS